MKKILIALLILAVSSLINASGQTGDTALLVIDIQNFYFPGGTSELVGPEKAAMNAAKLLAEFRKDRLPVIFIGHRSKSGSEINNLVAPLEGEKIIYKDAVNSFVGTNLIDHLRAKKIKSLVICGMQTHMCVEAATRSASDLGFNCTLIHDACATKDLVFEDKVIKAADVHYSTLSTLKNYARVITTQQFLSSK
jgi:nicotinamidase-related amidase